MGWRSRWFTTRDKGSLTHLSSTIAAITYATRALSRTKLPRAPLFLLPSRWYVRDVGCRWKYKRE